MENHKNIALVYNPNAGKGRAADVYYLLKKRLEQLNIQFASFEPPWPIQLTAFSSVWIIGGDGTLHHYINHYPDSTIPIALFKGGSGNDFAWKLYGQLTVEEYMEKALHGKPQAIDGGLCNGIYFINGLGVGFDGDVVRSMGKKKILPSHLAYLTIVLKKIFLYREQNLKIRFDNVLINEQIFMVSIANGSRYGGGFLVAPQSKVNDGLLDIVVIKKIAPAKRILYLPLVEKGKHLHLPFINSFHSKKISIESNNTMRAHLDGEYFESKQINVEILTSKFLFIL